MPTSAPSRDPLSETFAALANPTRRAILATLTRGDAHVGALAEPFDMSLPAVSKHLKVLERAHLIERRSEAQWRSCHLAPEPLKDVADWVERYRALWEGRLDRLGDYLSELQADAVSERPRERRTNQPTREPSRKRENHDV